jgi:F-type H+-transporting ATPase subunit b
MISIDYSLIIVILNFVLLLVILNSILYKPIKSFLTERQTTISTDLEEAENSKTAAEELVRKQEDEFKQSALEIRKLKEHAKKDAEMKSDEIIKQAREREKAVLADTEKQLVHEKQKVLHEIEGELGERITSLTSTIIGKHIDEKIDAAMIERLLEEERGK